MLDIKQKDAIVRDSSLESTDTGGQEGAVGVGGVARLQSREEVGRVDGVAWLLYRERRLEHGVRRWGE